MSANASFSVEKFSKIPVVGIIRGYDMATIRSISKAYMEAGFYALEITMNTQGATEMIGAMQAEFPELSIGAGTVCNLTDFNNAIEAGANFIVTPIINEEVIKASVVLNIPIFPGAYTPSEIYKAWSLGATAVKLFPATQLGVSFIKDVLAPLNDIKLLPTGGVSLQNIKSFFDAGVYGVGMGSSLLDKKMIQSADFEGLRAHFITIKQAINIATPT